MGDRRFMGILTEFMNDFVRRWAVIVIVGQSMLTGCGVVLLFGLCLYRKYQDRLDRKMLPNIQDQITSYACGLPVDLNLLRKLPKRQKQKVRGMILTAIAGLQGESRDLLMSLYDNLEFTFEDYNLLKDKNFGVRLGAIARLEAVMDPKAVSLIEPLMRDESPYVHFAALKYLLKQKKNFQPKMEAEMELVALLHRYDSAREILDCYSKTHFQNFLYLFSVSKNYKVRSVCLDVILKNRLIEAVPIVQDHIVEALRSEGHEEYDTFDFKKYTSCLTISPLPEAEELLIKMTDVADANVRICGYRALFKVRPDLKFDYIEKLSEDPSPQANRLYHQIREEFAKLGAAA